MITIEFLGPIGKEPIYVDIGNLNELGDILQKDKEPNIWLNNSAVAINDVLVLNIDNKLNDGDKITLLPPVCGG